MNAEAFAPFVAALTEYHRHGATPPLLLRVAGERPSTVDVAHFFRAGRRLSAFDRAVLRVASGRVLDVGAGAGALALALQGRGIRVTALEVSPPLAEILRQRGVQDVRRGSIFDDPGPDRWDTVVALMNGTALAGTRGRLGMLLAALRRATTPGGCILIDSTDLGPDPADPDDLHPGELEYQFEFREERAPPFPQLFVDEDALATEAAALGLGVAILHRDAGGRYLARLDVPARHRR